MEALDGNAIAGLLLDVFGAEMTTATGICATCGARGRVGEFAVYVRAPDTVVRCRSCRGVLMVFAPSARSPASTCAASPNSRRAKRRRELVAHNPTVAGPVGSRHPY